MPAPDLMTAEQTLTGRITTASNATFLGSISDSAVVTKPLAGEKPLWDLPDGCLAHREVATYVASEALDWNMVPRTWLRDGPLGEGMVHLWQETDPEQNAVDLVSVEDVPDSGWKLVLEGEDQAGRIVALIHEDTPALRRMAAFDVVFNNADRKGDHVLALADGHRYGVDRSLTFHGDHKLRTALWGWIGEALSAEELGALSVFFRGWRASSARTWWSCSLPEDRTTHCSLCPVAFHGAIPPPRSEMPGVPWPLF
ncbi:SCO1664 family protein [Arthrobacter sp. 7Tela_A1]|uniref:SCO1664 family protein n=1 Tax=Arthrobacter sp. 7Tela_A1 TaxID=3093745 RepID=UPI003BB6F677